MREKMHNSSITLARGKQIFKSQYIQKEINCKVFFIVKKSIEVDNANVIAEHFPLIPDLLGTYVRASFH